MNDSTFEDIGFPVYVDEYGTLVRQTETIAQESRQRAKNFTHVHQVELRAERSANIKAEIQRKKLTICLSLKTEFQTTKTMKIGFKINETGWIR